MIGIQDQYFGTEIEMTGITRQRAAEVVAELFGTEAIYEGAYYGIWAARDREGKKWKFMSDGSIDTQRKSGGRIVSADREYSTEMVSPKLSYDEMGKLQEVVRCLRRHGGFVKGASNWCGLWHFKLAVLSAGYLVVLCETCSRHQNPSGTVYITGSGNRYHNDASCSGLKRTVRLVKKSQLGDMHVCSKCG